MTGIAGALEVVKDAGALAARAAEIIAGQVKTAKWPYRIVLSGGGDAARCLSVAGGAQGCGLELRRAVFQR